MARRARPNIDRAATVDPDSTLAEVKRKLWEALPDITEQAIDQAKDGNTQVLVSMLRIIERLLGESGSDYGRDILDRITKLRQSSLEQVNAGSGHPPYLGTAGGNGTKHPDAGGEESRLVTGDRPPGEDL